ncbi:hypothetical protein AYI69_g5248 [Smittium culicis]|uniref:Uncharacterized protein n=1 Tax=Smittium culicis TaxID=133412 RepID=A0A1R1Y7M5_9FUNG|nr:hypothetical protein AYI69_g5248 [Smittium culicis]
MPLEPHEYNSLVNSYDSNFDPIYDQKSLLSIFNNDEDIPDPVIDMKKYHLSMAVLKRNIKSTCIELPETYYSLNKDVFLDNTGKLDKYRYYKSKILLFINTVLKNKVDYEYSSGNKFKLQKYINELARLADVSTPYQFFIVWLYKLATWENPRNSAFWCYIYFACIIQEKIIAFIFFIPIYFIIYYRIRSVQAESKFKFESPNLAYIKSQLIFSAVDGVSGKTKLLSTLYDQMDSKIQDNLRLILADISDILEMIKK